MDRNDAWTVTELLDEDNQPFAEDVRLAREMLSVVKDVESGTQIVDVRIPRQAIEFIENTLSEWFEAVADIEKRRGNMPYLIIRNLSSLNLSEGSPMARTRRAFRSSLPPT